MSDSTPIPTSFVYYMLDGELKHSPRYGINDKGNPPLPGNYALFYPIKTGGFTSNNITAKVFIHRNGNMDIKEFPSSKYGNNPKYLREAVENYIKTQLMEPQQTLPLNRKHNQTKSKIKIKRCKCK